MKNHYVSYEQAVKLKELGFDLECYDFYIENVKEPLSEIKLFPMPKNWNDIVISGDPKISCPRLDQVQEWLRDFKDTIVIAEPYWETEIEDDSDTGKWCFVVWIDGCRILCNFDPNKEGEEPWLFDTYEQALSMGISKTLELIN